MSEAVKRRPYASQVRAEAARQTRRTIVDAAARLFVEQGYGATSVDAIATAAGVGRKTVFTSVGGKAECLKLAIDWAITGDDDAVPVRDRERVKDAQQATDARWVLRDYADMYTAGAARAAALFEVLTEAVGLDQALRELQDDLERQRLTGMTALATHLDSKLHALRPDLTVADAAQLLCALIATATYQRLVPRHGWSQGRFIEWLGETLIAQLIRPDYRPSTEDPGDRRD